MSISSEAKRTLVKSPPELWSELSDAESLTRHLDGLGEIRITRTEPETAVDWEADGASGTVRLQASGFGTKVVLSLSREVEPAVEALEPAAAAEPEEMAEPEAIEAETAMAEPESEVVEPEPEPALSEPVAEQRPRLGFFARMFRPRRKGSVAPEPVAVVEPEPALEPEPEPEPHLAMPEPSPAMTDPEPEPLAVAEPEPSEEEANIAADLATLEAEMAERDEALLTAMLDRLGAAHHRPFSRG
jgi:hypothetical protein